MSILVPPKGKSSLLKICAFGDLHIPYHSPECVALLFQFLKDTQPDWIYILGDLLDCWELSHFRKFPVMNGNDFQKEIELTKKYFADIFQTCPKTKVVYIEGNHEFRIKSYLMERAKELYFLPSLRLEYLLELHKYPQVHFYELRNKSKFSHNFSKLGYLRLGHADMSRKEAGATAKGLRDELGCNVITGHTHKLAFTPKKYADGVLQGWEAGCLCKLNPDYMSNPNWQNGFLFIEANKDITQWTITPILIENNSFIFGGKVYKC